MKLLGELPFYNYINESTTSFIIAIILFFVFMAGTQFWDEGYAVVGNIMIATSVIFIALIIIVHSVDGKHTQDFYKENGKQFLQDGGVRLTEIAKYPESDLISVRVEGLKREIRYEPQKVKKITIDHYIKKKEKEIPELLIELDNGVQFLIRDGERLLKKEDFVEKELYFYLNVSKSDFIKVKQENGRWVIYSGEENVKLIREEKEVKN